MIIQAMEDYRSFDGEDKSDKESRKAFMNSIVQALHTLRSALKTDILDELREEVDALKEAVGI